MAPSKSKSRNKRGPTAKRKSSVKVKAQKKRAAGRNNLDTLAAQLAVMSVANQQPQSSEQQHMQTDDPKKSQSQQQAKKRTTGLRVGKGTRRKASAVSFSKSFRKGKASRR